MSDWTPVTFSYKAPPRGPGSQTPGSGVAQSFRLTTAWGIQPATAAIVYVGSSAITVGATVEIRVGRHFFAGICRTDHEVSGTGGRLRRLEFEDMRRLLEWDSVMCAFNMPHRQWNGDQLQRGYWHVYPQDGRLQVKTFTSAPLSAAQILNALLGIAPGYGRDRWVATPWTWEEMGEGMSGPNGLSLTQTYVYGLDCLGGRTLAGVLAELCERTGTVLTLASTPARYYHLVFTRKGYGALPAFPSNSDDRQMGLELSDAPNGVTIVGGRNRYQFLSGAGGAPLELVPDWPSVWTNFNEEELWLWVYDNLSHDQPPYGRYNTLENGLELAQARARRITVGEVAAARGSAWMDWGQYGGRPRHTMPAMVYLREVVLRAYRPAATYFRTRWGDMPLRSLRVVEDYQPATITGYDPVNGTVMVEDRPGAGRGMVLVKGVNVGADFFKDVPAERLAADAFSAAKSLWTSVPFSVDTTPEGGVVIFLDDAYFTSENLISSDNGYAVLNVNATIAVPQVRGFLTVEAERYVTSFRLPDDPNQAPPSDPAAMTNDPIEPVPELHAEYKIVNGAFYEIPYPGGVTANQKALQVAQAFLTRQRVVVRGGYKHVWDPASGSIANFGTALTPMIDRVEVVYGPNEGVYETVDFTAERQRAVFVPEREYDRAVMEENVFPGQSQLRDEARALEAQAALLKSNPSLREAMHRLLRGNVGGGAITPVAFKSGTVTTLPVGSVVRGRNWANLSDRKATHPSQIGSADNVFLGVTVRANETTKRMVYVAQSGIVLARVQGPVAVNDALGMGSGMVLVKDGAPGVGRALEAISDSSTKLVRVMLGAGGGGMTIGEYTLTGANGDKLLCTPVGGGSTVEIWKSPKLRQIASAVIDGKTVTYSYTGMNTLSPERTATVDGVSEVQVVVPRYLSGDKIYAVSTAAGLLDLNVDGRAWARKDP